MRLQLKNKEKFFAPGFEWSPTTKIAARGGRNPRSGEAVRHVARQEIISLAS